MMDAYSSANQRAGVAYPANEARVSAVSWAAVAAGAFVGAALSVTLLALGVGLGMSAISPWSNSGASAGSIGVASIAGMTLMHAIAAAVGGYIAGRLRTKWVDVHTDEVFFRDTAHGFLSWAVGIVIGAAFLASAAASLVGGAVDAASKPLAAAATEASRGALSGSGGSMGSTDPNAYFVDALLRGNGSANANPQGTANTGDTAATRAEVGRILANGIKNQNLPQGDRTYLAGLIATRTGMSQADAERRVDDVMTQARNAEQNARQAADEARKAAAKLSLWTFLSFLIGAFCASYAATIGGRQRDRAAVAG